MIPGRKALLQVENEVVYLLNYCQAMGILDVSENTMNLGLYCLGSYVN